jgi:hypothetical protein
LKGEPVILTVTEIQPDSVGLEDKEKRRADPQGSFTPESWIRTAWFDRNVNPDPSVENRKVIAVGVSLSLPRYRRRCALRAGVLASIRLARGALHLCRDI